MIDKTHYLHGFIHPRWLFRISSINSMSHDHPWPDLHNDVEAALGLPQYLALLSSHEFRGTDPSWVFLVSAGMPPQQKSTEALYQLISHKAQQLEKPDLRILLWKALALVMLPFLSFSFEALFCREAFEVETSSVDEDFHCNALTSAWL